MRKKPARHSWSLLIFIGVLALVIAVLFAARFYNAYQTRQWHEESVFIVFNSEALTIEVFDPVREQIRTYILPKNGYVEVPEGYGFYQIEDVRELSEVEGRGEGLLSLAVSNTFGIPFDTTTTTMNDWDKLAVWYARAMYEQKDQTTDLAEAPIMSSEKRIDGETINKIDGDKVDKFFKHDLWEKKITDENLAIGVFNASDEPNIALILSRKLEKIGAHITEIDNIKEDINGCELRVKEQSRAGYTTKRLLRLFGCRLSDTAPHSRFDIMLITANTP